MSEMKTLAGMDDEELRLAILSACKRHLPNIDLPAKYHSIVDGLPMIYGEGMLKGYEFAEGKLLKAESRVKELEAIIAESKVEHERTLATHNFDATRLRNLARITGVSIPESDEDVVGCAGTILGSIYRVVRQHYASPVIQDKE